MIAEEVEVTNPAADHASDPQKPTNENDNALAENSVRPTLLQGRQDKADMPPPDSRLLARMQLPAPDEMPAAAADDLDNDADIHPPYYTKVEVIDQSRLDLTRHAGSKAPPPSYRSLRHQIEDVERLVRILFQDDAPRRVRLLGELKTAAESGLVGRNANIEVGIDNLQEVKDRITDEFPVVRGKIWWWNLALLGATLAVCLLASLVYRYFSGLWYPGLDTGSLWPAVALAAFLIPAGVITGLFVEFVFRVSDDVPYEQLQAINPGRWKPFQRALNTLIVAYVFAAILGSDAFKVGIGSILLNDFIKDQPLLSLAIGFVTGFAYPYVRDIIRQFEPKKKDQ